LSLTQILAEKTVFVQALDRCHWGFAPIGKME
jgi:hypothetical protein